LRVHHGDQEAIEIQERAREASRSCRRAFSNRAIVGCPQCAQHDHDSGHIGIGVAVLVCSQAIALTPRGADHDCDYLLLIFAVVAVLVVFAFAPEGSS
jgi:hypothetical protein